MKKVKIWGDGNQEFVSNLDPNRIEFIKYKKFEFK